MRVSLGLLLLVLALPARSEEPLTLAAALELAAANNEVGAIAAARLDRALALRRQAIATVVPTLDVVGTYTRRARAVTREVGGDSVTIQALDALNGNATLESTLFDLRAVPLIRSARHGVAAQRLESRELTRDLAFDVATTFVAALSTERLRDAAQKRLTVAEKNARETELRLGAGLADRNELTRSELELANARLALTQSENAVRTGRLALGLLVGRSVGEPLVEPTSNPTDERALADLVAAAAAASDELAALVERAEAARQRALAPKLGFVPTLDLRALYRATNEAGFSGNERDWNASLVLTWELFDGGARAAEADLRQAEWREAIAVLAARRRSLAAEVEGAVADLDTARAALAQAEVGARVAGQNAEEVGERFRVGLASALEQADALVSQFEAEVEVARQGFAQRQAEFALARALGDWPVPSLSPTASTPSEETP